MRVDPDELRRLLALRLEEERDASAVERERNTALLSLLRHAYQHSAHLRQRAVAAGAASLSQVGNDILPRLEPLSRRALQSNGEGLHCREVPAAHLPYGETQTSGSSGEPVRVRRTRRNQLEWMANTLREHHWWRRDFAGSLLSLRANLPQPRISAPDWGPPANLLHTTGPGHALSLSLSVQEIAEAIAQWQPAYLTVYPNVLASLVDDFSKRGKRPEGLRQVRSIGEVLPPALRERVRAQWGVPVADVYSSQEVGIIAIECPEGGQYHVMGESLIVEVVDGAGRACGPGEVGDVLVTDLLNYATPLLRYAIGDQAEVGVPCACGRALPTLSRILGRSRNMVAYPDGSLRWPLVGFARYREVAPVLQYQIVQRSLENLEVRLVVERPLRAEEEAHLGEIIRDSLGFAFDLRFVYFDQAIPKGPGGKFEEFVRDMSAEQGGARVQ